MNIVPQVQAFDRFTHLRKHSIKFDVLLPKKFEISHKSSFDVGFSSYDAIDEPTSESQNWTVICRVCLHHSTIYTTSLHYFDLDCSRAIIILCRPTNL